MNEEEEMQVAVLMSGKTSKLTKKDLEHWDKLFHTKEEDEQEGRRVTGRACCTVHWKDNFVFEKTTRIGLKGLYNDNSGKTL